MHIVFKYILGILFYTLFLKPQEHIISIGGSCLQFVIVLFFSSKESGKRENYSDEKTSSEIVFYPLISLNFDFDLNHYNFYFIFFYNTIGSVGKEFFKL